MEFERRFLEERQKFSQSTLWALQSEAYCQFGPDAWINKGVPFYLTSNPYTAKQYAAVVLGFIRDGLRSGSPTPLDLAQPIYIFDLGAGTGRFGFLFLKELFSAIELLWPSRLKVRYIMTDIALSNIAFLEKHPSLQKYIREGVLDFAYYHHGMNVEEPIRLKLSQKVLDPEQVRNPVILIANYFFDTIPQDLFRIRDGKLEEGVVTTSICSTKNLGLMKASNPSLIEQLECEYDYIPLSKMDYYENPAWNRLLESYLEQFDNVTFLFPLGALQSIEYFSTLSQKRLLLLAGDQGVCTKDQVQEWGEPKVSRHGTFSIAVSYHALALFFQQQGGAGLLTTFSDPIFVVLTGILGAIRERYPETDLAFRNHLDAFEPQDYWSLVKAIEDRLETFSPEYLLKLIRLGNWDPMNFHLFFDAIRKSLPRMERSLQKELEMTMHQVWENFYPVSESESGFLLNLGVLFYELKNYESALLFFQRALVLSEKDPAALKNIAACYIKMNSKKTK